MAVPVPMPMPALTMSALEKNSLGTLASAAVFTV